jgi:hypothetical protein
MEEDLIFYKLKMTYFFLSQKKDDLNIHKNGRQSKKRRINYKYKKTEFYAMLTISTSQLLPGNLTNTTTKNKLAQSKKL